jgi:GT2 family glycosyltransferase
LKNHKVYCIIVTFNGEKWIEKCLESIELSNIRLNTIIIDNGSNDKTIEIIKQFSNVELIESGANLGFGKANNIGITMALNNGADYVFLLNQDAWVEHDTIDKLILAHVKNESFDIISPIHLNGKGDKLDLLFSVFIEPRKCPDLYSDIYCNSVEDRIYEVEFVNAAAWLLTRNCFSTIGGFSPVFYHYGEDDNYCLRARFHGLKVGVYPLTKIFHDKDYTPSKYDDPERILERQKLVLYADPGRAQLIDSDIYIYKMAVIKAFLKLQFKEGRDFYKKFKHLTEVKKVFSPLVNLSKETGPLFLNEN